ncbi:hypothetical protein [Streptomyces sp. NPDC020298]|uniref:DUF4190 domain-containing protein n=1 Tax=unclassified Streptomyces TaxID=2593676 RepID=UPI0033CD00BE
MPLTKPGAPAAPASPWTAPAPPDAPRADPGPWAAPASHSGPGETVAPGAPAPDVDSVPADSVPPRQAPVDREHRGSGPGVPLDKPGVPDRTAPGPSDAPRADPGPWAAPAAVPGPGETAVSGAAGAPAPSGAPRTDPGPWAAPASRPGPGDTAVSGAAGSPASPFVHDQRTVTSLPDAPPAWAAPAAPVAWSPPANPFAPPAATTPQHLYSPVPPPPIAPDGPGQLPYGYPAGPGYGWPGMQPMPSNGMGTAALSLGILAALCFCLWPLAIVLGVLAVIFGGIGRGKARRGEATNGGQALAGIICGAAGIVLGFAAIAFYAATA